jgi:hypothetical protein
MKGISKKIAIINQLNLPNELIVIIKEYIFYNIIGEAKKRKNKIISLFNGFNIYYSKTEKPDSYPDSYFPIISILMCDTIYNKKIKEGKCYFILTFCETCGKYIRRERLITYINKNLHCNC